MNINFKKYNIEQYLIFILIIFTFGIIGSKTLNILGTTVYVETAGVFTVLFILYRLIKIRRDKNQYISFFKENKVFSIIIILFSLLTILNAVIIAPKALIYSINKLIPFVGLLFLMIYLKDESKDMLKKYINLISYIFIVTFILAIIMYILGYTNGAFSLSTGLNLVPFRESIDLYGEVRLYWLLSHKSRFVIYCTIGFIIISKSDIKNKIIKNSALLLSLICVLLSNSMTGLAIYGSVVVVNYLVKYDVVGNLLKSKYKKIIISSIAFLVLLSTIGLLFIVGSKRDLSTLGSRTFIWNAGIEKIIENPTGIIYMPDNLWIKTFYEGKVYYFSNAHNGYLNEFIENGIAIGSLYLFFNLITFIKYLKRKDWTFATLLAVYTFVFVNLESVNVREMNYILFLAYGILYYLSIAEKSNYIFGGKSKNEQNFNNNMYL